MADETSLKSGDVIRVKFGSKASQLAVVHDKTRAGNIRVFKFSQKRRVWKGPLRLHFGELIGFARPAELDRCPPLPTKQVSA